MKKLDFNLSGLRKLRKNRLILLGLLTSLFGCTETMVKSVALPNGTLATAVSVRDAFTNDTALIIYDKDGKPIYAITGAGTNWATVLSGAANGAVINGINGAALAK